MSVSEAWNKLTDRKSPVNWIICGWENNKFVCQCEGTTGFSDFVTKFDETQVQFGGILVAGVDEQATVTSTRDKFIGISFVGKRVSMVKKRFALQMKGEVESNCNGIAVNLQFDHNQFTAEEIAQYLLDCGGAHKPVYYDFGGGERILLSKIGTGEALITDGKAAAAAPAAAAPVETKAAPAPAETKAEPEPAPAPAETKAAPAPKKPAAAASGEGKVTYNEQQKRHYIENFGAAEEPVKIQTDNQQAVYIGTCTVGVYQIEGKCKSITVNNCQNIGLVFGTAVVNLEIIGCKKSQIQIDGEVPIMQVDNSERITVYLAASAMGLQIYSSKSQGVNIMTPSADGEDMDEAALPEQFHSVVDPETRLFVHNVQTAED